MSERTNENNMRYLHGLPRQPIPDGRFLVHNHVIPEARLGQSGFRAWTQNTRKNLLRCYCDFGGCKSAELHKHYHIKFGMNPTERRAWKAAHAATQRYLKTHTVAKNIPVFQAWQELRKRASRASQLAYKEVMQKEKRRQHTA